MKVYRKRIADDILKRKLEGKGAVLIEGPKWCGKTTTAEQVAASILYMDDPEKKEQNITMSELNPKRLLRGETPRLIDEWQLAPKLWDAIRFEVDHRGELGQFVLTGSAVPPDTKEITHSGTGRFTWLTMRPMSLFESGESTGEVSLKALFSQPEEIDGESKLTFDQLAFLVCRGGWPQAVGMRDEIALDQAIDYYDTVVHADINRVDNVQKNPERVKRLMRSYARNQGSQIPNTVECDAVVHLRNGSYGLVEIKLGGDRLIEEGAANLKTLGGKIDTDKMKKPSFLMVLTGTGDYAYRRQNGVYVVPLGCLKD